MRHYILDENREPVLEPDLFKWGRWLETANRKIGDSTVGDAQISTVFLGLDHGFSGGDPILFETMIFGGRHDEYQERYTTREDALKGHRAAVQMVESS